VALCRDARRHVFDGKPPPRETGAWVGLSFRRDIRVSGQRGDRVVGAHSSNQLDQPIVLEVFERQLVASFKLYADGEIVATWPPLPA